MTSNLLLSPCRPLWVCLPICINRMHHSPDPRSPPCLACCSGDNAEEAAAWEAAWCSPSWLRALALFLRKVYGSPKELADGMLPICADLYASGGFATEGFEVAEQAWVHALGVAGLLLEQLTSARQVAAAGEGHFTLRDLLDRLVQPGLRHRSAKVGAGRWGVREGYSGRMCRTAC